MTQTEREMRAEQWKLGDEWLPFHPSASHVDPSYRDGWNAAYRAATALAKHEGAQAVGEVVAMVEYSDGYQPEVEWLAMHAVEVGTKLYTAAPDTRDAADAERYRWLTEDHTDRETRERCRSIIDSMGVSSYAHTSASIDAARSTTNG